MANSALTPEQKRLAVRRLISTVVDIIKDATNDSALGGIPNSYLYLACQEKLNMQFDTYMQMIHTLKEGGFIKERFNLLIWLRDFPVNTVIVPTPTPPQS